MRKLPGMHQARRNLSLLMLLLPILLPPGAILAATPAQPVLVELFTSEGCSSCPPADQLLTDLDREQPIAGVSLVVLSEHVDYWNSLGWKDPYSSREWSDRQSTYAGRFRLDSVYTPQMVIHGDRQVNGSDRRAVLDAVTESAAGPQVSIVISSLTRIGDRVQVSFTAGAANAGTPVFAVIADDRDQSSVPRGENAGRTLHHVAVARSITPIARLAATPVSDRAELPLPRYSASRPLRLLLFAQDAKTGHILGVAQREL